MRSRLPGGGSAAGTRRIRRGRVRRTPGWACQGADGIGVAGDQRVRDERRDGRDQGLAGEPVSLGVNLEDVGYADDELLLQLEPALHGFGTCGVHLDEEQPGGGRVVGHVTEIFAQHEAETLHRRTGLGHREDEVDDEPLAAGVAGHEAVLLGVEVLVEGRSRDFGVLDQVFDGGVGVALLDHDRRERLEQPTPLVSRHLVAREVVTAGSEPLGHAVASSPCACIAQLRASPVRLRCRPPCVCSEEIFQTPFRFPKTFSFL